MEFRKVIEQLRSSAKNSLKQKYKGDWADTMFRVYVLKFLRKISGTKEEIEQIQQESGIQKFDCSTCDGKGYVEKWSDDYDKDDNQQKVIEDCDSCKGLGFVEINVIDDRKESKNKFLEYKDTY